MLLVMTSVNGMWYIKSGWVNSLLLNYNDLKLYNNTDISKVYTFSYAFNFLFLNNYFQVGICRKRVEFSLLNSFSLNFTYLLAFMHK